MRLLATREQKAVIIIILCGGRVGDLGMHVKGYKRYHHMLPRIAHCLGHFLSRHRYARTMNWYVGPSSTVPRGYLQ